MIATQQIKSITSTPIDYEDYKIINVLKWNNSKYKVFCPYYLRTDGNEECYNEGNILFENFYQGTKVYDIVYENEVYPSKHWMNNPDYLWWKFEPINKGGDNLVTKNKINYELYNNWKNSLWSCDKPIRYPNKIFRRKNVQFALCIDKDGNETRMDYITTRKEIYMKEYIRLVKKLPEYNKLLNKLKMNKNIMICEIDVPAKNKKGEYGNDVNNDNICILSLEKLNLLLNDPNEAFGHGLCLAYALLTDLENN